MRCELFKARKAAGFTQAEIAEVVGIDRTAYNRIERGLRDPAVDTALKIAGVVGRRVEDLFLPEDVYGAHNEQAAASG